MGGRLPNKTNNVNAAFDLDFFFFFPHLVSWLSPNNLVCFFYLRHLSSISVSPLSGLYPSSKPDR